MSRPPAPAVVRAAIETVAQESFSRSGGPGGQNVNKVNTQVTLRVPLNQLARELAASGNRPQSIDDLLGRLKERLGSRVTDSGELVLQVSDTRSQARNRSIAVERATDLVIHALQTRTRRKPTKPGPPADERRLQHKHRRSRLKQNRQTPFE